MATASKAEVRQGLATVPEAAIYLNVSRATLYKLMDAGQLGYTKIGHCRRIPWRALEKLVADSTVGAQG